MKQRQDPSAKPYYRCLSCPRFRKVCGGIPTRGMDLENWCEYMRDIMEMAHLTNAHVAEEAEVSIGTIERIRAVNIKNDIMRATARRIELVVIGPVTRHICDMDVVDINAAEKIAGLQQEVEYWKKENDRKAKIIDKLLG